MQHSLISCNGMSKVFCIMVVDSVMLETVSPLTPPPGVLALSSPFPGTTWHETESNKQE